jgi:general secretion pathway protein C
MAEPTAEPAPEHAEHTGQIEHPAGEHTGQIEHPGGEYTGQIEHPADEHTGQIENQAHDIPEPLPDPSAGPGWKEKITSAIRQAGTRLRSLRGGASGGGAGGGGGGGGDDGEGPQGFGQKLAGSLPKIEPLAIAEWAQRTLQKQGFGLYGTAGTIIICTYFLGDLSAMMVGRFIPEPPAAKMNRFGGGPRRTSLDEYNVIFSRNLFSSTGTIPGEGALPTGPSEPTDLGGPPVKTALPFNLIGTMILRDELRSIATIEDKSASTVYPVRVEDEIPQKAKITKIEAHRVIFVNTASGRREFVELPEDVQSNAPKVTVGAKSAAPGIEKLSSTQFNIDRKEVDKALSDLNNILTQARAVPNIENGQPAGYKLFQIVPGSIYDKLGLQNGDVIAGLNGAPINDPGKAFEMLSELKTAPHLDLTIKRDGRSMPFSYDIH